MTRQKKIYIGLAGFAGFLLILLLVFHFLGSAFVNSEGMKEKIQTAISQQIGGKVEYKTVDLSLLPYPRSVVHRASIFLPGKGNGTIKKLRIVPKILPLFIGKLLIDKIRIESPDFKMVMPRSPEQSNEAKEPFDLDTFKDTVTGMLSLLAAELPEFKFTLKDGVLNIIEDDETVITLSDFQAVIGSHSEVLKINISGTSNIFEDISMIASFGQEDLKGKGEIELRRLQPQTLINHFLPDAVFRITQPIDKVSFNLKIDGPNDMQVGLKSSLPYLELHMADAQSVIKCKNLEGSLHFEEGKTTVSLVDLYLDEPLLNITGELVVDHETQQKSVKFTGTDIGINSIREDILNFLGENEVVTDIFQIMKGGTVPHILFTSQADTLADLFDMENYVIHGGMREGNIFIPELDLDMEEVTGDVVVEQGILKATHLGARLEDILGQEGIMSLGLEGEDPLLHVEIYITAAAGQIPPLLAGSVGDQDFISEIERVANVKGTVKGKLILGESFDAIDAEVHIDKINVSANYEGIPLPLHINDGNVHYDGKNIGLINVGGTVGNSSFSELTGQINLEKDARIEIKSGRVEAVLNEIYPWVSSFDKSGKSLKDFETVSGVLKVSSLNLKGPLSMPETWNIEATGEVEDIIVDTTLFPEPIKVKEGNIKVVGNKVVVSDAKVDAGDSSLRISGTISHNMSELVKADIGFHGELGKESMEWIEDRFELSSEFRIRPPLSIPEAHLTWEKDSGISFVSNLTLQDGPGFSLDMFQDSEGLEINNFLIQDDESNASFAFVLKEEVIGFSFTGNLTHTTTEKIFLNFPISKAWIKGDFQAHILLDQLEHSTFQGVLEGKNLSSPLMQKVPLNINDISLRADNKSVRVDSLKLTWEDKHLSVNGDVNISENGFLFDLVMSAEELDWDTIRKTLDIGDKDKDKDKDKSAGEEKRFWDFPVKGILKFDAESFTFDQYTLSPVQASISFDHDCISVEVTDANICGISTPGVLKVTPQDISLDFQLLSHDQELDTTIKCFGDKEKIITGKLDLEAHIMAQGAGEELGKSLHGNVEVSATNGRINRFGLLLKLFSFLKVTKTFTHLPGIGKEGFPYRSMTLNGEIQNGILMINEYVLNAPAMRLTSNGTVDILEKKLDLELNVIPFKVVSKIVSMPVKVTGDIDDPHISYIPGRGLLRKTKGVLLAPTRIINRRNKKNSEKEMNDEENEEIE